MGKAESYMFATFFGVCLGLIDGGYNERYAVKPTSAYMMDVNGDGINDVIVNGRDDRTILLGQPDGSFKRQDIAEKEQKESLDVRVRKIESKAK